MKTDWKKWCQKIGRDKLLLLIAAGVLLILSSVPMQSSKKEKHAVTDIQAENHTDAGDAQGEYVRKMEERLTGLLEAMEGVGEVHVMILLDGSETKNILRDENVSVENSSESDSKGGTRVSESYQKTQTTIPVMTQEEGEEPYVLSVDCPAVAGVSVVAQGAGNAGVREKIIQLIKALFGIEVNKIMVTK